MPTENRESARSLWQVALGMYGGVALIVAGTVVVGISVGVTFQDVLNSQWGTVGFLVILAGFILLFQGHKAELIAARSGDEWWLNDTEDAGATVEEE